MSKLSTATKRLLLGRPFRSDTLGHDLLPKRIALPVFASDALSSVAYAPEEIFLVLSIAGLSAYAFSPWIGLAVAAVLVIVVASYRQNVRAYPSGGGDYEIATKNLGATAGLTVGSALMVDYVLTVAVSLSSAAANIGSAVPFVAQHKVLFAIAAIAILAAVNLRGLREAGKAIAFPTYAFVACMLAMLGWGLVQIFVLGEDLRAESAEFELVAEQTDLTAIAFIFLLARAFSSGCAALTGVEAISTGVPAFRKPRARNAATTLFMLGAIAVTLFLGVVFLAQRLGVVVAENPATQLRGAPEGYEQKTLVAQLAQTIFSDVPAAFFLMAVVTAVILVLAANTAYNGFPVLASVLAQNRYLPRQLHTRGDRLAFSNGIVFLSGLAIVFVWVFDAEVTKLIQLYIVGVFVAFSLGQAGMVRHWTRFLATETDPASRGRMQRSRSVNVDRLRGDHGRAADRARHEVHRGRVDRGRDDGGDLRCDEGDTSSLRHHRGRTRRCGVGRCSAQPDPLDRARVDPPPADIARPGVRAGDPARHSRSDHRERRRGGHPQAGPGMGAQRPHHSAEGRRVAVS